MKSLFFIILIAFSWSEVLCQGCSDAGFCSLGILKTVDPKLPGKNRIDIGTNAGWGEEGTFTLNPYLQYSREVGKRLSLQGKLTATYANGFLGNNFGVGDLYALATYAIREDRKNNVRLLAGLKIPFNSSNTKNKDGRPLPLDYQSSLGTYDAIIGGNYTYDKHLEINAGVQLPVVQKNENTFFPDEHTDKRAENFAPTNNFRRRADLLLRAGYYITFGTNLIIKPNLLAIYHAGEDTYEDRLGVRTSIDGSRGLTLNGAINASISLKNKSQLELIVATPFIVRKVRPDGLTREAVVNLQYSISF